MTIAIIILILPTTAFVLSYLGIILLLAQEIMMVKKSFEYEGLSWTLCLLPYGLSVHFTGKFHIRPQRNKTFHKS